MGKRREINILITVGQVMVEGNVESRVWITRNETVKIQEPGVKIKIFYNGWCYGNHGNTQKSQNKVDD